MDGSRSFGWERDNIQNRCVVVWDDSPGTLVTYSSTTVPKLGFVQELFTRDDPFPRLHVYVITKKILDGQPSRPHDEVTYHRLTNEWWDLCTACWNHDPSLRPEVSEIVEKITTIVCLFCVRYDSLLLTDPYRWIL